MILHNLSQTGQLSWGRDGGQRRSERGRGGNAVLTFFVCETSTYDLAQTLQQYLWEGQRVWWGEGGGYVGATLLWEALEVEGTQCQKSSFCETTELYIGF